MIISGENIVIDSKYQTIIIQILFNEREVIIFIKKQIQLKIQDKEFENLKMSTLPDINPKKRSSCEAKDADQRQGGGKQSGIFKSMSFLMPDIEPPKDDSSQASSEFNVDMRDLNGTDSDTSDDQSDSSSSDSDGNYIAKDGIRVRSKKDEESRSMEKCFVNTEIQMYQRMRNTLPGAEELENLVRQTPESNKYTFLKNYGFNFEIPSAHLNHCKFYTSNPRYMLKVINYIIPGSDDHKNKEFISKLNVKTYNKDREVYKQNFQSFYAKKKYGVILKLFHRDKSYRARVEVSLGEQISVQVQIARVKFSRDGRFLAVFIREHKFLRVYEIVDNNVEETVRKIKENAELCYKNFDHALDGQQIGDAWALNFANYIRFDLNNKYLVAIGERELAVFDLDPSKNASDNVRTHTLSRKHSRFYDLQIDSSLKYRTDERPYKLELACKKRSRRQVDIFDIDDAEALVPGAKLPRRTLTYNNDNISKLKVKISTDFQSVILANGDENYELRNNPRAPNAKRGHEYTIRNLPQLKEKVVQQITATDSGQFYILACAAYDRAIDLIYTGQLELPIKIKHNLAPGILNVYDLKISVKPEEGGTGQKMIVRVASSIDGGFATDTVRFNFQLEDKQIVVNQSSVSHEGDRFKPIRALCAKWPYVVFSDVDPKYLLILNAFDPSQLHRVELLDQCDEILQSYITSTNDLFIMTQHRGRFRLQMLDLDASNKSEAATKQTQFDSFRLQNLIEYHSSVVGNKPLVEMFMRGSSRKEEVDTNQQLVVFLLHEDTLYSWVQDEDAKDWQKRLRKVCMSPKPKYVQYKGILDKLIQRFYVKESLQTVCTTHLRNIINLNDGWFFALEPVDPEADFEPRKSPQKIVQYKVQFSDYDDVKLIFSDAGTGATILNFEVDKLAMKLLIVSEVHRLPPGQNIRFQIFDLVKQKITYQAGIQNPMLSGRLISGLFTLINGHMYYDNRVVKIRYDLLSDKLTTNLPEEELFPRYCGILPLNPGESVLSGTPLDSFVSHRMVYIIKDRSGFLPSRILILPYLNERKVYLNRSKPNAKYFQTVIDIVERDKELLRMAKHAKPLLGKYGSKINSQNRYSAVNVNLSENKFYIYSQRGLLQARVDFGREVKKHGQFVTASSNGLSFILMKQQDGRQKKTKKQSVKVSVMQLDNYGLKFIKEIDVLKDIKAYAEGEVVAANVGLKKIIAENSWIRNPENVEYEFRINNNNDVFIAMNRREKGLYQDIQDKLSASIRYNISAHKRDKRAALLKGEQLQKFQTFSSHRESVQVSVKPNKVHNQHTVQNPLDGLQECSKICYFQKGCMNTKAEKEEEIDLSEKQQDRTMGLSKVVSGVKDVVVGTTDTVAKETVNLLSHLAYHSGEQDKKYYECLYFVRPINPRPQKPEFVNYRMNNQFAVFWTEKTIWSLRIDDKFQEQKLSFQLPDNDPVRYIKDVRVGSKLKFSNHIAIILHQNVSSDCIVIWNISKDIEKEVFDVGKNYEIIWGSDGKPVIVLNDSNIFTSLNCSFDCHDTKGYVEAIQRKGQHEFLNNQVGHKVDGLNHNFIIMDNHFCLAFSYMSFIIKGRMEVQQDLDERLTFDKEAYNYIMNKTTPFMEWDYAEGDHEELKELLDAMLAHDKSLMNLLQYTRFNRQGDKANVLDQLFQPVAAVILFKEEEIVFRRESALHMAVLENNTRAINILLHFISLNECNSSKLFIELYHEIVDQPNFLKYFATVPIVNQAVQQKQTLKIEEGLSDKYVGLSFSDRVYLDDHFFQTTMGEDEQNKAFKSYAVKVQCIRYKHCHARQFFETMVRSESLEYFQDSSILMMIDALYPKFQRALTLIFVPLTLFHIGFFVASMAVNETIYLDNIVECDERVLEKYLANPVQDEDHMYYGIASCDEFVPYHGAVVNYENQRTLQILGGFNMIFVLAQFLLNLSQVYIFGLKIIHFHRFWQDLFFVVCNGYLSILEVEAGETIETQRLLASAVTFLIFGKTLLLLQLSEELAPLIDIIIKVFWDIKDFMYIFLLALATCASSYYYIGRNQMQFDNVPVGEEPDYATWGGAFWNLWYMCLGDAQTDSFFVGDATQKVYLILIFIFAAFFMLIHMLNMLIAIMGETFAVNTEVKEFLQYQEKALVIFYYWQIVYFFTKDAAKNKYIVAVYPANEEGENQSDIEHVISRINHLEKSFLFLQDKLIEEFENLKVQNSSLAKQLQSFNKQAAVEEQQ